MTFILQDIIVCGIITFAIGLYVGAFVQRRRDVESFRIERKINEYKRKLENEFNECEGDVK